VEDAVDALDRSANRAPVEDVAAHTLDVEVADQLVVGAVLDGEPQVVAAVGQEVGDV
jgi:hypothetical protein